VAAPLVSITDVVRSVLRDPDIELSSATRFDELSAWDSMHLIAVVVEIESRFNLLFELDEIENLHAVGDLLRLMAHKQALAGV
jgi:acyl carrier protein